MKSLLLFFLLILGVSAQTIDVTTYGAKPDGGTDSTVAIENALAAAGKRLGSDVYFPCGPDGSYYLITHPITFPSNVTVRGTHRYGCQIIYRSQSAASAAFSLVNSSQVILRDIALESITGGVAPATILMLGGAHGMDGQHVVDHVTIGGVATMAMVYSIASENNQFRYVYFDFKGGGAGIGFYTSAKDDFGICPACDDGSNLSITMEGMIFHSNVVTAYTAVEDKLEGGCGDHIYRDGYLGMQYNAGSAGFTFISGDQTHGGPNVRVTVQDFRIEDGGSAFVFLKDYQDEIHNVDITGVTWESMNPASKYFIYGVPGLKLENMRFVKNIGENKSTTAASNIDTLENSTVMEDYGPITINTRSFGNYFVMMDKGVVNMPSVKGNVLLQPTAN